MRERVQEILMEIGIPANLKGFKYILDIMELFRRRRSMEKCEDDDCIREGSAYE